MTGKPLSNKIVETLDVFLNNWGSVVEDDSRLGKMTFYIVFVLYFVVQRGLLSLFSFRGFTNIYRTANNSVAAKFL